MRGRLTGNRARDELEVGQLETNDAQPKREYIDYDDPMMGQQSAV